LCLPAGLTGSAPRERVRAPRVRVTLNRVVQHSPVLDRTFSALADRTRREILERLGHGPATISELAVPFGMSLTGVKKHVRVLEEADLVITQKVGRVRECRLGPGHLDDAASWIEAHRQAWQGRFDRFERYLVERTGGRG
jgi:DNA-binding transcriptional ArsR family regulator